ncbi:MAG TPA: PDZ domain-containing protein [Thermoanaerobaculia bacterium]|nr:PDZ domain-containing protein [Thermoanaerobaculia bacterium]
MKLFGIAAILQVLAVGSALQAQAPPVRPGFLGFGYTVHKTKASDATGWLYVRGVAPGSPAERASLKVQDLVTSIDGKPIAFSSDADVLLLLAEVRPGQKVRLTTLRNQQKREVTLTAAAMTDAIYARWKENFELAREAARRTVKRR